MMELRVILFQIIFQDEIDYNTILQFAQNEPVLHQLIIFLFSIKIDEPHIFAYWQNIFISAQEQDSIGLQNDTIYSFLSLSNEERSRIQSKNQLIIDKLKRALLFRHADPSSPALAISF